MKSNFFLIPIFLFCGIILFSSCKKDEVEPELPSCFDQKLIEFDLQGTCSTGATIDKYIFRAETVYTLNPGNCGADLTTEVIDEECNTLGNLGGILGNNKINGHDFSEATFVETVWGN